MIQNFSSSYYLKPYWVINNHNNNNKINNNEYLFIKNNIYNNSLPVIMKLGKMYFEVKGDSNIPINTIQLSSEIIFESSIKRIPEKHPIFITKPEFAKRILNY